MSSMFWPNSPMQFYEPKCDVKLQIGIIGHCVVCGNPIYGRQTIDIDAEKVTVVRTCECVPCGCFDDDCEWSCKEEK